MARKKLINEINQLEQQLAVECSLLKLESRERRAFARRIPMLWLVGGTIGAGLLLGRLTAGQGGLLALGRQGLNALRLASMVLPGMSMSSMIPVPPPEEL